MQGLKTRDGTAYTGSWRRIRMAQTSSMTGYCSATSLAVMDADETTASASSRAQAVRNSVKQRGGGRLYEFPVNLESSFGVKKHRNSAVPAAIQAMSFAKGMPDPACVPEEVTELAKALKWLTR
jgi:hypothetical protein